MALRNRGTQGGKLKVRAFLAFDIPDGVRVKLAAMINDFSEKERGVKWVNPENMHVTMKFFGEIEEDLLLGDISSAIVSAVKGFGASQLLCKGIGVFPNWKYPRVFWAGFTGDIEKVIGLQKQIEDALSPFDIQKDKRGFRLHLTLGRAKGTLRKSPLTTLVEKLGPVVFGTVAVERLIMYKSELRKSGAIYTELKGFEM